MPTTYTPDGPFVNQGPPAINSDFLNKVEATLVGLVEDLGTKAGTQETQVLLDGKVSKPPSGGYIVITQFSSSQSDPRVVSDVESTQVRWVTTYSGRPTNAAGIDEQRVVLA